MSIGVGPLPPLAASIALTVSSLLVSGAAAVPSESTKICPAQGGALRSDVDGDATSDHVSVRRCELVVVTKARVLTRSLASYAAEQVPKLNALVQLDATRGREIAVDLIASASSGFVGVFRVSRERLVRMSVAGEGPALFAYAGSVRHLQGVDCASGGGIVLGFAAYVDGGYSVERRFLRVVGSTFREQPKRTARVRVRGDTLDPERFPEFAGRPFPHCRGLRR